MAVELCRTGRFAPSLTLDSIRVCKDDTEWLAGYTRFVGGDINENVNPLKQHINPEFGRRVKAKVRAEYQPSKNGKPARRHVKNEIVGSCTLFRDSDPAAIETS